MLDPVFDNVFHQAAVLLALSAIVGAIAVRLRQPLIVAFIGVGIAAGPYGAGMLGGEEEFALLAEIGIALLLFAVGLKLDLHLIKVVGPVALVAGLGQVTFTSGLGFLIALALGFEVVTAVYIAIALTFSSTIIIVKLLSDKREVEEPHGRIALGILIIQDIVVVVAMISLTAFGEAEGTALAGELVLTFLRGAAFLGAVAVVTRWILPALLNRLAEEYELLVLFTIAWAVALAAAGDALGFSKEVGAFVAGVALASSGYREVVGGRLVTLRDFLLVFFFINLGASLDLAGAVGEIPAAAVFSLFVLLGNPLIVMVIMGLMGYRKRTSFLTGLTVAQISEFSLIFAALGVSLGHIDEAAMALITKVGILTIALSTYLILYSKQIFERIGGPFDVFEREHPKDEDFDAAAGRVSPEVVIFGLGRYGSNLYRSLRDRGVSVVGVDFEPHKVKRLRSEGYEVIFGDASDPEVAEILPLGNTRLVIAAMPELAVNIAVLRNFSPDHRFGGRVAVTAHIPEQREILEEAGAEHVLLPFTDASADGAERISSWLSDDPAGPS